MTKEEHDDYVQQLVEALKNKSGYICLEAAALIETLLERIELLESE